MITAFTVKNFKAIGDDPVRIELKPITLLFGANSAGKSSILHALNYANVLFNDYSYNVNERTLSDDDRLNLGGFKRFIHGGDLNRNLVLRFDLDFVVDKTFDQYLDQVGKTYDPKLHPKKLLSSATSAYVEIEISWSSIRQYAYVSRYETGINGERIVAVYTKPDVKGGAIRYFNTAHSVFNNYWIEYGISLDCLVEESVQPNNYNRQSAIPEEENVQYNECETPQGRRKVFERLGRVPSTAFILATGINNINLILDPESRLPRLVFEDRYGPSPWLTTLYEISEDDPDLKIDYPVDCALDLQTLLRALLVLPGEMVGDWLKSMLYLGPLREIPPRNFISCSHRNSWTKGLAAWDMLYKSAQNQLDKSENSAEPSLKGGRIVRRPRHLREKFASYQIIEILNRWLASDQRLNTGYQIVVERYREVSSDDPIFSFIAEVNKPQDTSELIKQIHRLPEKIRIQLEDTSCGLKLEPHEIGTGISQVLPVVVAAVANVPIIAIEQPELHIHPAMQVQLGDLFITQSFDEKFFLIETHSEHLLLRLLRRINETYENRLPPDINPCTPDDVAIYYLEKGSQGLRIRRLEISEDGDSKGDWPEGFFEERRAELF